MPAAPPAAPAAIALAAVLASLLSILFAASYATLIAIGNLQPVADDLLGLALFSAGVFTLIIGLRCSHPGTVPGINSEFVVLAALVTTATGGAAFADAPQAAAGTAVVLIGISAVLVGIACLTLGSARAGVAIRYIPLPVLAGFIAGIGWLSIIGALVIALRSGELAAVLDPANASQVVTALATGALLFAMQRLGGYRAVLGAVVLVMLAFFITMFAGGETLASLGADGWLVGPFETGPRWTPTFALDVLGAVSWSAVAGAIPGVLAFVAVATVGVLLVGPALELVTRTDIDVDRELRCAGEASLLSGVLGGMPGCQYLSTTTLVNRLGADHRAVTFIVSVACFAAAFLGLDALALLPRPIASGVLLMVGIELMFDWLVPGRRLRGSDYVVMLAVLGCVAGFGIVYGVVVGLLAAVVFFAVNYARHDVVRQRLTAAELHSRVARSDQALARLRHSGDEVLVLRLEGVLFFGSVNRLLATVQARADIAEGAALATVIIDFRAVRSVDGAAVIGLLRLVRLARARDFELLFADVAAGSVNTFAVGGLVVERRDARTPARSGTERRGRDSPDPAQARVRCMRDLDHALEWAEDALLARHGVTETRAPGVDHLLRGELGENAEALLTYGERRHFQPGELLMSLDEPSPGVFLVAEGRVSAVIELADGSRQRVRRMGAGAVLGEIGVYLDKPPSAAVVADDSVSCVVFSRATLARMQYESPTLAAAFHAMLARILAFRLDDNTRLLSALQR